MRKIIYHNKAQIEVRREIQFIHFKPAQERRKRERE